MSVKKAILLLTGCYLSYLTRNVDPNFAESKALMLVMFVLFAGFGILLRPRCRYNTEKRERGEREAEVAATEEKRRREVCLANELGAAIDCQTRTRATARGEGKREREKTREKRNGLMEKIDCDHGRGDNIEGRERDGLMEDRKGR